MDELAELLEAPALDEALAPGCEMNCATFGCTTYSGIVAALYCCTTGAGIEYANTCGWATIGAGADIIEELEAAERWLKLH